MLLIFPLIYLVSFFVAVRDVYRGNTGGIFKFFIFGLAMYTTAMSVAYTYGLISVIPIMQAFKETLVFCVLLLNIANLKQAPRFHLIDYLILAFLGYMVVYALLPIGEQNIVGRFMSLKSTTFYVMVYLAGRFCNPRKLYINEYFTYVVILTIAAAVLLMFEVATQTPIQFSTGYFEYAAHFFNLDASGAYGLQTTFTSDSGYIRFASFFTNPLEHAAATIVALSVIAALYTKDNNKIKMTGLAVTAFVATVLSIMFALSRAPLASYCLVIYIYALVTKKNLLVNGIQTTFVLIAIYVIYLFSQYERNDTGLVAVLLNTIDFSDPSSVGHLLAWIDGIISISEHPLGIGLGSSGRVGASLDTNIGGENQFIIIGVQAGLIALTLYLAVFVMFIRISYKWLNLLEGKERKVCMAVLLIKVGLAISTLSSEIESSSYVSYMNWFLSGILISIIMQPRDNQSKAVAHAH